MVVRTKDCVYLFLLLMGVVSTTPNLALSVELGDVLEMDIHRLMQIDIEVTSVSKRPQKLNEAASAIYVVTQEDIRRSGAVNIPEALRLVPGVWVAKIDQTQYAVSIRGFNSEFRSKKLQVFVDGRSIYSPLSSGIIWAALDIMLEDIDRIEVIRGPGAVLWGSNAVALIESERGKHFDPSLVPCL